MNLLKELQRRNVIRVAMLYVVASWLILQVADLLFDAFDVPSWSMRLLVAILILGLVFVLVFSWVFEITADGLKRETDGSSDAIRRTTGRKMNIAIALLIVLGIGVVVVDRLIPEPASSAASAAPESSIAVMPFVNMSDDPDNEYFSDGLSEELLNLLSGIPQLRVTARMSSFSLRDEQIDVREVGKRLNVAHVLEGSVRKSGNRIRVTAQLIDTDDGYHLWSETYDRTLEDIFAVQDEISTAVASSLRSTLLGETPQSRPTSPEAFSAYLYALHFYRLATIEGYARAEEYLKTAIDLDPEYAPAWNLMATTYANQALTGQAPFQETQDKALKHVEKALEIDPDFAYANSSRAWLAMTYESDYAVSAEFFRRASDLAPNDSVILGNRAVLARTLGYVDRAIEMSTKSRDLNPISPTPYVNLADQLYRVGKYSEAIESAKSALELAPGSQAGRANLALAYLLNEQPELALETAGQIPGEFYESYVSAMAFHFLGRRADSDAALARMLDLSSRANAFYVASVHAWRGETDRAFEWLQRALREGQPTLGIRTDPFLRNLHDDPRWNALLEQIGLSDDQVASIRF